MNKPSTVILGIESSCDDTAASVVIDGRVISNVVAGQDVHIKYGGVVPELASRAHQSHIIPVVNAAVNEAEITPSEISAIAYTRGPGLLGSLLVGGSFAKGLSIALNKPLIEVHHMRAHVLAHFIKSEKVLPRFPFLCLTVSGGHTQIVLLKSIHDMEVIGETLDDAAGECFDKAAKMLGLPYPGGPKIDEHASIGNHMAFHFPLPKAPDFNYSFSGLKTSLLYFLQKNQQQNNNFIELHLADICASFQHTLISYLLLNFEKVATQYGVNDIGLAGGVAANKGLRNAFSLLGSRKKWQVHIPSTAYCTDNAAMIAIAGYYNFLEGRLGDLQNKSDARLSF